MSTETASRSPIEMMFDGVTWTPVPNAPTNEGGLPYVTHQGELDFNGVTVRVFQLSDGKRVVDEADIGRLFGWEQ